MEVKNEENPFEQYIKELGNAGKTVKDVIESVKLIVLTPEQHKKFMDAMCVLQGSHMWDKNRKSHWKCLRCGKKRRARKSKHE
jgi:hypothetical protein